MLFAFVESLFCWHTVDGNDVVVGVFLPNLIGSLIVGRVEPGLYGINTFKLEDNDTVMRCLARNHRPFAGSNINTAVSKDRGSTFRQIIFCIAFFVRELIEGNRINWRFRAPNYTLASPGARDQCPFRLIKRPLAMQDRHHRFP